MEKMRLAAIYNVWDDWDLLKHSVKNMLPLVDAVIIVYSESSNWGEYSKRPDPIEWPGTLFFRLEPHKNLDQRQNETSKRNYGLDMARNIGYTHFIMMDADEFYTAEDMDMMKARFDIEPDLIGLVGRTKTYFKHPNLTIGFDVTLVPMIHRITPELKFEFNRRYPFAWMDGQIKIDPTRSMNINDGVGWTIAVMHHMSWVRKDIQKKIRNSTARQNIERSTIVHDYVDAKPGAYCQFYRARLEVCGNLFNIPDIIDESLCNLPKPDPSGVNTNPI